MSSGREPDGIFTTVIDRNLSLDSVNECESYWIPSHGEPRKVDYLYNFLSFSQTEQLEERDGVDLLPKFNLRMSDARIICDTRSMLRWVFVLNANGAERAVSDSITKMIRHIQERGGESIAFVCKAASGIARLTGAMDRVHAYPQSPLTFHDTCLLEDDGALRPFAHEESSFLPSLDSIIARVQLDARSALIQKIIDAQNDESNADCKVSFSADEFPDFIQTHTWQSMREVFTSETSLPLHESDAEKNSLSRQLYVWSEWANVMWSNRNADPQIAKATIDAFTSKMKAQFPWVTTRILAEAINGPEGDHQRFLKDILSRSMTILPDDFLG